jgi:hypothetical protein
MTTVPASLTGGPTRRRSHVVAIAALSILVVILAVLLARSPGWSVGAGTEGSGIAATEVRTVAPFTSVELAGSNRVSIRVGPEQRIEVHADDNLVAMVTTEVRDGALVIDDTGDLRARSPMSVEITVPALDRVTLRGSGNLAIRDVGAEDLTVELPGSGTIQMSGTAVRLDVVLEGSGVLDLDALLAGTATVVLSGSGSIGLSVSEALDATISGSGTISYGGDPDRVTQTVTGSGAIVRL